MTYPSHTWLGRALLAAALLLVGACGNSPQDSATSTLERLRESGVVRVGYANEAPYAYVDQTTGQLTGEAPGTLRKVMERLGVRQVEGVVAGTVELGYATELGIPRERILVLPDNPAAVDAIRAGRADAFGGTALTVKDLLAKAGDQSGLEQAQPFEQPVIEGKTVVGYGAFAVRKADDDLREAINAQLADFLGTPEHLQLVQPFGFGKDTLPGKVTAAELCAE